MKKPVIRVMKWLKGIPVEAVCSVCPDAHFRVQSASYRPSREEYTLALQRLFDEHVKLMHKDEEC